MTDVHSIALRIVLVLVGAFIVFIGINVGFGGILTLGWQGQTPFFAVTDVHGYLVQDSHIRFLGAMFAGMGLFLIVAATTLRRFHAALKVVLGLIFIGGLGRFTMLRPDVLLDSAIIGSLSAELILMPSLYIWVARSMRTSPSTIQTATSADEPAAP
jgi:hypothetical protein